MKAEPRVVFPPSDTVVMGEMENGFRQLGSCLDQMGRIVLGLLRRWAGFAACAFLSPH